MAKQFRVKLKRSTIGCTQPQKDAVRCLGLKKRESEVVVPDNPAMRGQILKVQHLVEVKVEK
jgi:large subunit ribosomal protein L30